jgi:palmitoyl transferase
VKKYLTVVLFFILTSPTFAMDCSNMWSGLTKACEAGNQINTEGKRDLYITGWDWHNPHRDSSHKINGYREFAYGGGIGKSRFDEYGNEHSLYGIAFANSHNDPQLMLGYAFQAYWHVVGEFKVGLGYTFGLTSRRDIWHSVPFPHILPLISLRYRAVTLMASYIPRFGGGENGDAAFIFGKYTFS